MSSVCISIFHFAYKLIYMKHDLMSLFLVASTEIQEEKLNWKKNYEVIIKSYVSIHIGHQFHVLKRVPLSVRFLVPKFTAHEVP